MDYQLEYERYLVYLARCEELVDRIGYGWVKQTTQSTGQDDCNVFVDVCYSKLFHLKKADRARRRADIKRRAAR